MSHQTSNGHNVQKNNNDNAEYLNTIENKNKKTQPVVFRESAISTPATLGNETTNDYAGKQPIPMRSHDRDFHKYQELM